MINWLAFWIQISQPLRLHKLLCLAYLYGAEKDGVILPEHWHEKAHDELISFCRHATFKHVSMCNNNKLPEYSLLLAGVEACLARMLQEDRFKRVLNQQTKRGESHMKTEMTKIRFTNTVLSKSGEEKVAITRDKFAEIGGFVETHVPIGTVADAGNRNALHAAQIVGDKIQFLRDLRDLQERAVRLFGDWESFDAGNTAK